MSPPTLEAYDVSPVTGFLPECAPLVLLPPAFAPWLYIAGNLSSLIKDGKLREAVNSMPTLSVSKLLDVSQQQRAYSVLAFLAHAYVWSPPAPCDHLPTQIAEPLVELSRKLGLPAVGTYAALVLWNFKFMDPSRDPFDLSNLDVLTSYTGEQGETWFYCVSVALEKSGGPCLQNGMRAIEAAHRNDPSSVIFSLLRLREDISNMCDTMMKLYENLDPGFFYNTLRPFLAGWKGMEKNGLPEGVFYGDEKVGRKYAGGSNGQSSLIQALDIMLGVHHHATGERSPLSPIPSSGPSKQDATSPQPSRNAYLMEMRNYMPEKHREFLQMLEEYSITREFVKSHESNVKLVEAYDGCIKELRDFRSKHIQVVMRYISLQSRKQNTGVGLAQSKGDVGTGGTELMPFLKQTRDEVADAACGDWARNIVSYKK